jgi:hypothetical protein
MHEEQRSTIATAIKVSHAPQNRASGNVRTPTLPSRALVQTNQPDPRAQEYRVHSRNRYKGRQNACIVDFASERPIPGMCGCILVQDHDVVVSDSEA